MHANKWLSLNVTKVELPSGIYLDHYVLRQDPVAVAAILDSTRAVLMLWRHRFITDTWGWELPGGIIDPGETPLAAASREAEEETGWRPTRLRHLVDLQPANGLSDCTHHVYWTDTAEQIGKPEDTDEADRLEWIPLDRIPTLIRHGDITASTTAAALLLLHRDTPFPPNLTCATMP